MLVNIYVDFKELENYTIQASTTVLKVIDNIIKLENNDVFVADENMEYSISELDDVVIFKQIIDKYNWIRDIDSYVRMKKRVVADNQLLKEIDTAVEYAQVQINRIGENVIELYKLVINDTIYEVDKKE